MTLALPIYMMSAIVELYLIVSKVHAHIHKVERTRQAARDVWLS